MKQPPSILIYGNDLSTMMAAINLCDQGFRVVFFSPVDLCRGSHVQIQEGLNFSESEQSFIEQTLAATDLFANVAKVTSLAKYSSQIFLYLQKIGVPFQRQKNGAVEDFTLVPDSQIKTVFCADRLGHDVVHCLEQQILMRVSQKKMELRIGWEFLQLLLSDQQSCNGAILQNLFSGQIETFPADLVLIGSGEYSSVYGKTTNGQGFDGHILNTLFEQGFVLSDLEMIQLTSTALECSAGFLEIPFFLRHRGAQIFILQQERPWYFLQDWYPQTHDLTADNLVCAALQKLNQDFQFLSQPQKKIFLDLTAVSATDKQNQFPTFFRQLKKLKPNLDHETLPLEIAVKDSLGGVITQSNYQTSVQNVFVCGSADAHTKSQSLVFGNKIVSLLHSGLVCSQKINEFLCGLESFSQKETSFFSSELKKQKASFQEYVDMSGPENWRVLTEKLSKIMTEHVLLEKNHLGLEKAYVEIKQLEERFHRIGVVDKGYCYNAEVFAVRALYHKIKIATLVILSSLSRKESRSCFYRADFRQKNDIEFSKHTLVKVKNNQPHVFYEENL